MFIEAKRDNEICGNLKLFHLRVFQKYIYGGIKSSI